MRRIRSAGHWLILVGTLGAAFAVALEGRVGRAALGGLVVLATGATLAPSARLLFAKRSSGTWIFPRALRVGVPVVVTVGGCLALAYILEGRAGPATHIGTAALAVGALVAVASSLLYAVDDGVARFSLRHRVGIPFLVAWTIALAATVPLERGVGQWTLVGLSLLVFVASLRIGMPSIYAPERRRWRIPRELRLGASSTLAVIVTLGVAMVLEGRAATVLILATMTFVLAVASRIGMPILYAVDLAGRWRVPQDVRVRVLSWAGVLTVVGAVLALEGRVGPVTLALVVSLALVPLVRSVVPILYGMNRRGQPRFALEVRVGVAIAALFVVTLGALAASLESTSTEIGAAPVEAPEGPASPNNASVDASAVVDPTEPPTDGCVNDDVDAAAEPCVQRSPRGFSGGDLWTVYARVVPAWQNPLGALAASQDRVD